MLAYYRDHTKKEGGGGPAAQEFVDLPHRYNTPFVRFLISMLRSRDNKSYEYPESVKQKSLDVYYTDEFHYGIATRRK